MSSQGKRKVRDDMTQEVMINFELKGSHMKQTFDELLEATFWIKRHKVIKRGMCGNTTRVH